MSTSDCFQIRWLTLILCLNVYLNNMISTNGSFKDLNYFSPGFREGLECIAHFLAYGPQNFSKSKAIPRAPFTWQEGDDDGPSLYLMNNNERLLGAASFFSRAYTQPVPELSPFDPTLTPSDEAKTLSGSPLAHPSYWQRYSIRTWCRFSVSALTLPILVQEISRYLLSHSSYGGESMSLSTALSTDVLMPLHD
jgi:hypothetical protein